MLSKKQVVPVNSISAILIRAAAYPSSAVKFPCRTQIRSHSQETSSRSSAAPRTPSVLIQTPRHVKFTSEECLSGMHMGTDQARNDDSPHQIQLILLLVPLQQSVSLPNIGNLVPFNENCSIENNVPIRVDRDDCCMKIQHPESVS